MGDNQSKPSLDNDLKDDKENQTIPIWAIVLFVIGGIGWLLIIAIVTMRFLKIGPFRKSDYKQLSMEESAGQKTPNCTTCEKLLDQHKNCNEELQKLEKSLNQYKHALEKCKQDVQELFQTNQEWKEWEEAANEKELLFQKEIKELADDVEQFLEENPRN